MNRPLPDKVAGIVVERRHVLSEEVSLSAFTPKAAQHTTEGSLESAMAVFSAENEPNLLAGRDANRKIRLIEYGGIGLMARALEHPTGTPETNRACRYQVEIAGFRQEKSEILLTPDMHVLDDAFREVLAEVYALVAKIGGVPLKRGGDGSRSLTNWTTRSGWFGHIEVPNNDHTDPGGYNYEKTFALAMPKDEFRLYLMDGEGKELAHSSKFQKGDMQLAERLPNFADEMRPELWDDRDVKIRLKKA